MIQGGQLTEASNELQALVDHSHRWPAQRTGGPIWVYHNSAKPHSSFSQVKTRASPLQFTSCFPKGHHRLPGLCPFQFWRPLSWAFSNKAPPVCARCCSQRCSRILCWLFFLGTHVYSCSIPWGTGVSVMHRLLNRSPHDECETFLPLVIATGTTLEPHELLFMFSRHNLCIKAPEIDVWGSIRR